ncbi:MAG: RNA-binding protein [Thermostichales cyanobacterium SZTDM-1c_bins_54]
MTVRLYAGNLPPDVEREALEGFLTAVAEILSVKVVRDRKTNRCKGYGFVTVATPEIAETLISKLNGTEFAGQTLKLEIAQPKEKEAPVEAAAEVGEEGSETPEANERPRLNPKKQRPKGKSSEPTEANATPVEPDPRWASQLQRIKEQLLAAGKL